jgi:hypothetical protein
LKGEVDRLNKELKDKDKLIADLMCALDDANMTVHSVGQLFPIKEICKVREGRGSMSRWPFYMWELIIEQLVNGTPPSAVNNNIIALVKCFLPSTKISEMPSIWTIWQSGTVLLIIVQTLAVYRIAKANKWEQLFTDGTSRWQVAFRELVISIEEDELFR